MIHNSSLGQPLTKKHSYSLITPPTLTGYTEFFRQNSNRVDGWIEVKIGASNHSNVWQNRWFIFDDGILKYSKDPKSAEDEYVKIPMNSVITLKADSTYGNSTLLITTTEQTIFLRLANTDEMYKWLFCFQKSVALVLTHLMQESSKKMSSQSQYPQNQQPQMPSKFKDDKNNMATTKFNSNSINSSDTVVDGNDNNNSNYYNDDDNSNQTSIWYNENGNYTNRIKNKNTNFRTVSVDSSKHSNYHHHHGKSLYSEEPLNDNEKYDNRMQANNHHQSSNNNSRSSGSSNNMAVGSMPSLSNLESYLSSQATNNRFNSYNTNLFNSNTSSTTTTTTSSHTQYLPTSSSAMIPIIRSREVSVEKVATSYKEDNIGFRLESLLQSLSDSRSQSCHSSYNDDDDDDDDDNYPFIHDVHDIDDDNNDNNEDYRRNNQQLHEVVDDDEDMIFELDESFEIRKSLIDLTSATSNSNTNDNYNITNNPPKQTSPPSRLTAAGKLLQTLDNYTPDRRASYTSSSPPFAAITNTTINGSSSQYHNNSNSSANSKSPSNLFFTASSSSSTGIFSQSNSSSSYRSSSDSDSYITAYECGYCTKLGPRSTNEDRFVCLPNIYNNGIEDKNDNDYNNRSSIRSSFSEGSRDFDRSDKSKRNNNNSSSSSSHNISADQLLGGGSDESIAYFAVYDGHGGHETADYLQHHLLDSVCNHPSFRDELDSAIVETCIETDLTILNLCHQKRLFCGSTAIGAFITGSRLTVFNIGDSQAVLCNSGIAIEMSESHKPGRSDEKERIIQANGWITEEKELYMGRLHRMDLSDPVVRDKAQKVSWVTIHRVCGELSVSRSFGDPDYKRFTPGAIVDAYFLWPENHNQIFYADLVIPTPECKVHQLTSLDEFLILASDGLWDVISSAEAVMMIKEAFQQNKSPSQVAEELCELSIKLGSSDNVTIVIVKFIHPSKSRGNR